MKRQIGLILALGGCLVSAGLRAEDAYSIKLRQPARGESIAISKEKTDDTNTTVENSAGKVESEDAKKIVEDLKYREEVLEKEPGHRATKLRRIYEKAQVTTNGQTKPLPYEGKTLLIEKKGGKYRFQIEEGREITGPDARFLIKEFARESDEDQPLAAYLPRKAVAVGDSWKLDLDGVVKSLSGAGKLDADLDKAQGSGKLMKVYEKDGHRFGVLEFDVQLPLKAISAGDQKLVMQPGALFTMKLTLDACIDGSAPTGTLKSEHHLKAVGTATGADKNVYKFTLANEGTSQDISEELPRK